MQSISTLFCKAYQTFFVKHFYTFSHSTSKYFKAFAGIAQDFVNNDEWLPKLTTYYISFSQKFLSKKITCMANFNFSFLISYCNHIYLELYLKPSLVSISGVGPHSGGGLRSPKCERLFLHTCQESEPGPGARCRGSATGVQLLSLST